MDANFDRCLVNVLKREGGFSNNPNDPGGATMQGVTQRVYDAYRRSKGENLQGVRSIARSELEEIYRYQYWNLCGARTLPIGIDDAVFDEAVNSGVSRSVKDLQSVLAKRGLYRGKIDGVWGMLSADAIRQVNDLRGLINSLCDYRLSWLRRLMTWKFFGKGWTNRVEATRSEALTMVG